VKKKITLGDESLKGSLVGRQDRTHHAWLWYGEKNVSSDLEKGRLSERKNRVSRKDHKNEKKGTAEGSVLRA